MIEFRGVSKWYHTPHGRKVVLDGLDLTLPPGTKLRVLGRNGAGKSTLLGMIGGTIKPNRGEIVKRAAISWPLGLGGAYHQDLTGAQNVRFVARIYGVDTEALVAYVADFSELGEFMDMPVRSYSSGMRARLAFGMSMGSPSTGISSTRSPLSATRASSASRWRSSGTGCRMRA